MTVKEKVDMVVTVSLIVLIAFYVTGIWAR